MMRRPIALIKGKKALAQAFVGLGFDKRLNGVKVRQAARVTQIDQ